MCRKSLPSTYACLQASHRARGRDTWFGCADCYMQCNFSSLPRTHPFRRSSHTSHQQATSRHAWLLHSPILQHIMLMHCHGTVRACLRYTSSNTTPMRIMHFIIAFIYCPVTARACRCFAPSYIRHTQTHTHSDRHNAIRTLTHAQTHAQIQTQTQKQTQTQTPPHTHIHVHSTLAAGAARHAVCRMVGLTWRRGCAVPTHAQWPVAEQLRKQKNRKGAGREQVAWHMRAWRGWHMRACACACVHVSSQCTRAAGPAHHARARWHCSVILHVAPQHRAA